MFVFDVLGQWIILEISWINKDLVYPENDSEFSIQKNNTENVQDNETITTKGTASDISVSPAFNENSFNQINEKYTSDQIKMSSKELKNFKLNDSVNNLGMAISVMS